jgi:hypothetical protein
MVGVSVGPDMLKLPDGATDCKVGLAVTGEGVGGRVTAAKKAVGAGVGDIVKGRTGVSVGGILVGERVTVGNVVGAFGDPVGFADIDGNMEGGSVVAIGAAVGWMGVTTGNLGAPGTGVN